MASPHHNGYFRVLLSHQKNLESSLLCVDTRKLAMDLFRYQVISKETEEKFGCLDAEHLETDIQVRYLLQQVCERVKEDYKVYDRLVRVLSKFGGGVRGVCEAMRKELDEGKNSDKVGEHVEKIVTEKDVPYLTEMLVDGSHRWESIGIALKLPKYILDNCNRSDDNVVKLNNVLTAWASDSYEGRGPATLECLRTALASRTVHLKVLAGKVDNINLFKSDIPIKEQASKSYVPEIVCQSYETEVSEGKSTLLEVEVSCNGCESYQWSKDSQILLDGIDYSGVSSSILYINRASQGTEGKYSCTVSNGCETVCTDDVNVEVKYPPEEMHLMKHYNLVEREASKNSWPPVSSSTFVNLVLVKQGPIRKCDYYTVRGDMDDILESKEKVTYEEIFSEYEEGELLIVEGRPGSGKTTLVHKVTSDWVKGKALRGSKMVFLITLRILNNTGADRNLSDLLSLFYDCVDFKTEVDLNVKKSGGKGVCFILDGLDEYQNRSNEESVIYQLIHKRCLRCSNVIVASRPIATKGLKNCCSRRIEVVGFTKSQIYKYVESYPFTSSDIDISEIASSLKTFLHKHPNVLHMCYLPVHAAMICFLFRDLGDKIPHTETQIYEQFTIATLLRQRTRSGETEKLKSLKELCGKEEEDFKNICELAYRMSSNSEQVVSESDVSMSFSDVTSSVVGLITVEQSSRYYGIDQLYTFHHLTFQEYLAAVHIARQKEVEQRRIICGANDAFDVETSDDGGDDAFPFDVETSDDGGAYDAFPFDVETFDYSKLKIVFPFDDGELKNVKKFYCGLLGAEKSLLLKDKSFLQHFVEYRDYYMDSSYGIQCAFESQHLEFCNYLVANHCLIFCFMTFTVADFAALGYVISTASQPVSKLVLNSCSWDYDEVMALSSTSTTKLQRIKSLEVSVDTNEGLNGLLIQLSSLEELELTQILSKLDVECFCKNVKLLNLTSLRICLPLTTPCSCPEKILKLLAFESKSIQTVYCYIDPAFMDLDSAYDTFTLWKKLLCHAFGFQVFVDSDISWLCLYNSDAFSSLCPERFSYCTEVILVNCGIDDERAELLANRLNSSMLETVVLDFNYACDSGAVALAGFISRCRVLQVVCMECNSIGDSGATALASALVNCSSLRRLDLQGNAISDEGAVALAKAAEDKPHLDLYLHNVNITEEGVKKVLELRSRTKIKRMKFSSSCEAISASNIHDLKRALECGSLSALTISDTNIDNIKILELEYVRNFKSIKFDYELTHDKIPTLCDLILNMNALEHLQCKFHDSVGSNTALVLANSLRSCRNLHSLSLSNMDKVDSSVIVDMVKCCSNIQSLELTHCSLHLDGVTQLFSDHKSWLNLHTLNLHNNNISSEGVQALSKMLIHCKHFRYLNLGSNNINDSGCSYLAEGLQHHTSLLGLKLAQNNITSHGVAALIPVIRNNSLQKLDLSFCKIGSEGVVAVMKIISSDTLQTLNLQDVDMGLEGVVALSAGLMKCTQLVKLNISHNNIGSHDISSLAEGLQNCSQLAKLDISNNWIRPLGMSSLAEGFQHCTNLKVLILRGNRIKSVGVAAIVRVMKACKYLKEICLDCDSASSDVVAELVVEWQHKSMLKISWPTYDIHNSCSLYKGLRDSSSRDHLLEVYNNNDYVIIPEIPKLITPKLITAC